MIVSPDVFADQPFLSLEVESVILNWQDEFVLQLTIYGPDEMELPPVTIDGLDQFKLQGTGKNLLQIPRGKTKKWVLTYTLVATDPGNFKVGPAVLNYKGQNFRSNIVFLTIEGPARATDEPRGQKSKDEKKSTAEKSQPAQEKTVKPPVVMSAAQIGDRIMIIMETAKRRGPYQLEGIPVTVRLLSQLPVENLEFLEEADFPGFLRYDFPFTSKPRGEVVNYRNKNYAAYELVKFLLFPLEPGQIRIPPVRCALKVRVPSGAFPEADLKLDLERASNILQFNVAPVPEGAVVGDFVLKNEIVADEPQSKIVRLILEGKGQLSTFKFPEIVEKDFQVRTLSGSTTAKIQGEDLISRKTQDFEILPINDSTASVAFPEMRIRKFDPDSATTALLKLPRLLFTFRLPGRLPPPVPALPKTGSDLWILFVSLALLSFVPCAKAYRPVRSRKKLRLHSLFSKKNLKLKISKNAARSLYQEITQQISAHDHRSASLNETIIKHLPQVEWLNVQRGLRKLEQTAYSPVKTSTITYEEMKRLCEKIELLWMD